MPRRHRNKSKVGCYNKMEGILNSIHGHILSLPKAKTKENNRILNSLFLQILSAMSDKDNLFKQIYRNTFYGGSYYDGVRIKEATEFDLDILLDISRVAKPSLVSSDVSGFVHLENLETNTSQKFWKTCNSVNYLHTDQVLTWVKEILMKVLSDCPEDRNGYILKNGAGTFHVLVRRGGPALTLHITEGNKFIMDVDLVVCFVFGKDHWPAEFTPNTSDAKTEFFIVPKAPKCSNSKPKELYWRLSFQEQERELIKGKKMLKPVLRLLKKLRDNQDHKFIASYYLKTVLLLMVETTIEERRQGFWNNSLSFVFMNVLKKYQEYLESQNIPYFWNRNHNLLDNVKDTTLRHLSDEVNIIIDQLEGSRDDPHRCSQFLKMRLLNEKERVILERYCSNKTAVSVA